jgi:hypothetical protein
MPFTIYEFDGLVLPGFKEKGQADELGTGLGTSGLMPLPGGGFYDSYRADGLAPAAIDPVIKQCRLFASSSGALLTAIDAIRAKKRKRGVLKARWHDGTLRWVYARLLSVHHPAQLGNKLNADITLEFEPESDIWRGNTEAINAGPLTATGGGNQNTTHVNAGNVAVGDLVITVTAGTSTITNLVITNTTTGQAITFAATIATSKSLVINVGARSVLNDGANAYASATIGDVAEWMRLQPGSNTIRFTVTGNATTNAGYSVRFYNHYA